MVLHVDIYTQRLLGGTIRLPEDDQLGRPEVIRDFVEEARRRESRPRSREIGPVYAGAIIDDESLARHQDKHGPPRESMG